MRRCALCQIDYPDALEFCPGDGSKLPPIPGETKALYDPLIGSTIDGRYLVDAVIGEGGMGLVYSARHAIIDKRVAIKVLRKEAAADESAAQRFLAEAKAASKIGQQNIVDITDFGVLADGHAYFVMEFLDGTTLGKMVSKGGPIEPALAASIAIQVARGLHAAHGKGIIHRDLKPDNIFVLNRDGIPDFVKIVDFGIARDSASKKRLTVAGMVMGTPEYMAPEQASGQETDHRVDQYALGCILYESLTGMVPFMGENAMQTLTKHVFEALTPPSVRRPDLVIPPPLEAIIVKSLSKKRDDRYASMDEMMRALQEVQPQLKGIALPLDASVPRHREPTDGVTLFGNDEFPVPRRSRMPFVVAGGITLLAAGVLIAIRSKPAPPVVAVAPNPTPPIAAPPPVAVVPAPPPSDPALPPEPLKSGPMLLSLQSIPPGADVFVGDEKVGVTPTKTTRPRSDELLHVIFRRPGFKDATREVSAADDAHLEVMLAKDVVARPGPPNAGVKKAWTLPTPPPAEPDPPPRVATPTTTPAPEHKKPPTPPRPSELRNPFGDSP